jgi:hypothetical protein
MQIKSLGKTKNVKRGRFLNLLREGGRYLTHNFPHTLVEYVQDPSSSFPQRMFMDIKHTPNTL